MKSTGFFYYLHLSEGETLSQCLPASPSCWGILVPAFCFLSVSCLFMWPLSVTALLCDYETLGPSLFVSACLYCSTLASVMGSEFLLWELMSIQPKVGVFASVFSSHSWINVCNCNSTVLLVVRDLGIVKIAYATIWCTSMSETLSKTMFSVCL